MSADNWEICPRCVSAVAWMEDLDREKFRTFREDYEFWGADEGEVRATYKGQCTKCGLRAALRAHERFYP